MKPGKKSVFHILFIKENRIVACGGLSANNNNSDGKDVYRCFLF